MSFLATSKFLCLCYSRSHHTLVKVRPLSGIRVLHLPRKFIFQVTFCRPLHESYPRQKNPDAVIAAESISQATVVN